MTLRTPVPKRQLRRPKRHRPITWHPPTAPSQPVSTISSRLRRQGRSHVAAMIPMTAPTMTTPTMTTGYSYGQPVLQAQEPPPALPEYSQPECPGDGYLWTPGYWSYAPQGYYWVPGAWRSRLKWATCGRPDIGEFTTAGIAITTAHGVYMSATTVALTMDTGMAARAIRAGTGADVASTITAPSTM